MGFLDLINSRKVILLDGAMGTQLTKRGLTGAGENNLQAPEAVLEIHQQYVECRCDALTTNTLTMNRIYIETHNIPVDVQKVNQAGAELARRAAGKDGFVLGDISSTGQLLEPYGNYKEEQFYHAFKEQAQILADGGVDAFIIETMFDLNEALTALRACKENFSLPVIVSLAFATETKGGRTIMGNTAQQSAQLLTDSGADVVGANCGQVTCRKVAHRPAPSIWAAS